MMGVVCLTKPSIDDVLKEGIYGPKEIKPEERRKFLGTLRERIVIALKKSQVRAKEIFPQVEQMMKDYPGAHLYLNGKIHYPDLSKYIKLAKRYKIDYTIVTNKDHDTEIGLVLAMGHAIDKEDIYIDKKEPLPKKTNMKKEKRSIFKKLFKRKRS